MAKKKLPYTLERYYEQKPAALREAARLRKTGKYNAKVLLNLRRDRPYKWALWTQRKSDRP